MMWNFRVLFIHLSEDVNYVWRQMGAIFSNDCEHAVSKMGQYLCLRDAQTIVRCNRCSPRDILTFYLLGRDSTCIGLHLSPPSTCRHTHVKTDSNATFAFRVNIKSRLRRPERDTGYYGDEIRVKYRPDMMISYGDIRGITNKSNGVIVIFLHST
ncbi:hypothetical protein ANN_15325 [Periplaneta americana]|uniref:Uncharacterized protein n=1 Tax=Periplaneta americana TaxID=6978 RepID=A0ABQ8SGD1_PERAM|nr:hypothetical protein ANN_15325 [Periplaneta americana]